MDSWSYIILGVFIVSYLFNLYPKNESQHKMSKNYDKQINEKEITTKTKETEFADEIKETLSSVQCNATRRNNKLLV